jgi:hypothetical protein
MEALGTVQVPAAMLASIASIMPDSVIMRPRIERRKPPRHHDIESAFATAFCELVPHRLFRCAVEEVRIDVCWKKNESPFNADAHHMLQYSSPGDSEAWDDGETLAKQPARPKDDPEALFFLLDGVTLAVSSKEGSPAFRPAYLRRMGDYWSWMRQCQEGHPFIREALRLALTLHEIVPGRRSHVVVTVLDLISDANGGPIVIPFDLELHQTQRRPARENA